MMLFFNWISSYLLTFLLYSSVLSQKKNIRIPLGTTRVVEVDCFKPKQVSVDDTNYKVDLHLTKMIRTEFVSENKNYYIAQFTPKTGEVAYRLYKESIHFSKTGKVEINGIVISNVLSTNIVRCQISSNLYNNYNITTKIEVYNPDTEGLSTSETKNIVIIVESAALFLIFVCVAIFCYKKIKKPLVNTYEEPYVGVHANRLRSNPYTKH